MTSWHLALFHVCLYPLHGSTSQCMYGNSWMKKMQIDYLWKTRMRTKNMLQGSVQLVAQRSIVMLRELYDSRQLTFWT